jgi:Flp pilus assembly protein TadG
MRRQGRERGAVAITSGLLMIPLLILAAFGLDFGNAYSQRQAYASGADSGALAAISQKREMVTAARALNPAAYPDCSSVLVSDPGSTAAKATAVSQINRNSPYGKTVPASDVTATLSCQGNKLVADVRVNASVGTSLGGMVGVSSIDATRLAQAVTDLGGKAACGLCIIGQQDHDIQNGNVEISNGNVAFNGNAGSGPNGEVNVTTSGGTISIEGDRLYPSKGEMSPAPLTQQPKMADPLAFLTMPPDMTGLVKKTNICTDGPGIYASFAPTANSCNIGGGLYVIVGGTHYSGQGQVNATGATIYFTCKDASGWPRECGAGEGEDQELTGQSTLGVTAPTSTTLRGIPGVALLADRNYAGMLSFRGNPAGGVTGTIYLKGATLDIRGNGETTTLTSLIVVDDLTFSGNNATLTINYSLSANIKIPPLAPRLTQ